MFPLLALDHKTIAVAAAAAAAFMFVFAGYTLFRRFAEQYRQSYVDGAASTLDSMYITMPAQNLFYLGVLLGVVFYGVVAWFSGNFAVGVPFFLLGIWLPRFALRYLKRRRDEMFLIQLVDTLMNMSNSLRAGFSLNQALELIHREMPNPMSQEMRLVCQELRLGVPIEDALNNLYKRMPSEDLDLVVTAIAIIRDVGGNLTEIFDNIAHLIRERQRIQGKIRTLTAQGKLQAIVMCCLPLLISVGLYYIAPDLFAMLFYEPLGWGALFIVFMLMAVAVFFIRKIIAIDV